MDTQRLRSFVKVVDMGSITRASDVLFIAQPALSQQIAALEREFKQRLLIRSKRGVEPTAAGRSLYRYSQAILRMLDEAQAVVAESGNAPAGTVMLGLAPCSIGSVVALELLLAVRERFPGIVLHVNENYGGVISEAIMSGRMDLAFIYDPGPMRGVHFEPLLTDNLVLLVKDGNGINGESVSISDLATLDMILPPPIHTVRQVVDEGFRKVGCSPRVVAENASSETLTNAVKSGIGATILPSMVARRCTQICETLTVAPIEPTLTVKMSLCTADWQSLSEPATIVHNVLTELIASGIGIQNDELPNEVGNPFLRSD